MHPPWHSCHLEKAQEMELLLNALYESIHLTNSKSTRLFGLAGINQQGMKISHWIQKQGFSWSAAHQHLRKLCAARGCIYGATGISPWWRDKWIPQRCPSTLHINHTPSPSAGDFELGRWHMTLNALYKLHSRMSFPKLCSLSRFLGSCYKLRRIEVKPKTSDSQIADKSCSASAAAISMPFLQLLCILITLVTFTSNDATFRGGSLESLPKVKL